MITSRVHCNIYSHRITSISD